MSFGFAVGDFIATGELIVKIVNSVQGSKSEYQELIRELVSLGRALDHVDKLKGRGDQAIAVDQIKCAALTCRYPLETFLSKIQKYEKSLGLRNSSGRIKDAARKIQWAFGKKDEISRLRDYLNIHVGTINILLVQQGLEMLDVAAEQRDKNQEDLKNNIEGSSRELRDVRGDLQAQALAVRENNSMIQKLSWIVGGDVVAPMKALYDMVAKVCVSTQQIYTIVLELRTNIPGIDTRFTYFQAPVKVEDVLGRVFPFPSECSVSALNAEIKVRFKEGPGGKEVKAGRYEMFNTRNTDLLLTATADSSLLPGMSVSMAIVLEKRSEDGDECPMPHCTSRTFVDALGGGKTCSECDVWFNDTSKKRKRGFEGEEISQHIMTLADEAYRSQINRPNGIFSVQRSENTHVGLPKSNWGEGNNIAAFKRIRFNRGLLDLSTANLVKLIDENREVILYSDRELRNLLNFSNYKGRKWARSEFFERAEEVLLVLKADTKYSAPFLTQVNILDAPEYYHVIKYPMDLGTMTEKLGRLEYTSGQDFVDDLDLIWANCLKYNSNPDHPLRPLASAMREKIENLVPFIPNIVFRDRKEVENEERRLYNPVIGGEKDSDDEPIESSRGRWKAPAGVEESSAVTARPSILEARGEELRPLKSEYIPSGVNGLDCADSLKSGN